MNKKNIKQNSKWTTSSSTYNDYINFAKNWNYNLNKMKSKNNFKLSQINNGTLSIQTEGNTKGTFTANQSGNTTINITKADFINSKTCI